MKPLCSFELRDYVVNMYIDDKTNCNIDLLYNGQHIRNFNQMPYNDARDKFDLMCVVIKDIYKCEHPEPDRSLN